MKYAHPYTKTAQGVLMDWSDDLPREAFVALDNALSAATDAAKDVEAERDAAVARAEKLREVMRERERLITTARLMGAASPEGHITRGIDRSALAKIAEALAADEAERGVG